MSVGMLVLRVVVGVLFVGHGAQKLFGWFGGQGLAATGKMFGSLGLEPGKPMAAAAALSEIVGGALLAVGFLTPLGSMLLTAVMATAFWTVHKKNGLWNPNRGYEFNLVLATVAFAVTAVGPGAWSVDRLLGLGGAGLRWALIQLGAGIVGSALTIAAGRSVARRRQRQSAVASL